MSPQHEARRLAYELGEATVLMGEAIDYADGGHDAAVLIVDEISKALKLTASDAEQLTLAMARIHDRLDI